PQLAHEGNGNASEYLNIHVQPIGQRSHRQLRGKLFACDLVNFKLTCLQLGKKYRFRVWAVELPQHPQLNPRYCCRSRYPVDGESPYFLNELVIIHFAADSHPLSGPSNHDLTTDHGFNPPPQFNEVWFEI